MEAFRAVGLEYVVDGTEIECAHCMILEGGHEDDRGGLGEPLQHLREVHAIDSGHPDIEEDRVDRLGLQHLECLRTVLCGAHFTDSLVLLQYVCQLGARRCFVINGENTQATHLCIPLESAPAEFSTVRRTNGTPKGR